MLIGPDGTTAKPKVACLVVAAGRGLRAGGGLPKQYRPIAGIPMLKRTLQALASFDCIDTVLPVIGHGDVPDFESQVGQITGVLPPVFGGATRQASVLCGLEALASAGPPDLVLVHDGARPFVSVTMVERVIVALRNGSAAVIPVLPVTDTIKRVDEDRHIVRETVDRTVLRRVQTPQGFRFDVLLDAHRAATGAELTDDAAVMEQAGADVNAVDGDAENTKITTPEDFQEADRKMIASQSVRTGMGFDVHRFEPGDAVTLCGVSIPHTARLAGHSDADVGLHALTDAILGAIAAGDIGDHFPPSDPQWKGAASDRFLRHAADLVAARGGAVTHVDVTLICEKPKIGPHKEAMRMTIAGILGVDIDQVSVKATTTEKLGFTGRGEGIAAQAVASVRV
ncbi:bifunctional 2-C-methyl-D-erythritol 4-phosphate cytidylyltransferase/2-C-methyl-D-erythritol 2,4-cyclodiphosphate synthase [Hwanghaeella grinnelliae]|uniref:Bifunctional enzyme IspD/IspF n=1 Tax=Hwanghaeella grinnelliae TaxID=2500179 RepID=A0A437QXW2_9PROT|nr:bifunctional 2-C-methyl-D-erythritol 4-phosphate cytidylyltransferase/2-C-methyl-D-erythritol 2,4-cyclodiphosphate synthase [Hwanghaeella grinnelliae]RVU39361.1 bifunctional 2-C-methyl-D-erythritol 4-phosphate cytidylyltransferase/2-C-methyl-D-erythritol 2,4-cyclodiphosphate synthase [Hwanghaeella grinnelliae]